MAERMNDKLYRRCKAKGFTPTHVAEVGVYYPETSNVLGFIEEDEIKATLVEANPICVKAIQDYFSGRKNVEIFPYAITDKPGTMALYNRNASSYLSGLEKSPALVNDQYEENEKDKFYVEAKLFSDVDDGSIDLLAIDIEGSEWFVLKNLKSKPGIISVETHGKHYTNPFIKEIQSWMKEYGYRPWYKDKSDTIYVKEGLIPINFLERLKLLF
jgi:FkbM family methyltransferase